MAEDIDLTAGGGTRVKITVATIASMIVMLFMSYQWHYETFITTVRASEDIGDVIRLIEQKDRETSKRMNETSALLAAHIEMYDRGLRRVAIKDVQNDINDTRDKLFALEAYPDDERRRLQERELTKRLEGFQQRKECLIAGNALCD